MHSITGDRSDGRHLRHLVCYIREPTCQPCRDAVQCWTGLHAWLERACRQACVGWYRRFSNAFQLATYSTGDSAAPSHTHPPSLRPLQDETRVSKVPLAPAAATPDPGPRRGQGRAGQPEGCKEGGRVVLTRAAWWKEAQAGKSRPYPGNGSSSRIQPGAVTGPPYLANFRQRLLPSRARQP